MANNRIGAIWKSKYGGFTGKLEIDGKKIDIIVFENKKKTLDKQPDYDICVRKPKEQEEQVEKVESQFDGVDRPDVPW